MNVKRIEFLTLGLTFVGALVLFLVFKDNSSYGFGLVYGSLISLINFQILYIGILKNSFQNIIDTKMNLKRNRNIRMLIYLVAIVVVYFLQEKINIITTIIGLFMIKLTLVVSEFVNKKGSDSNDCNG